MIFPFGKTLQILIGGSIHRWFGNLSKLLIAISFWFFPIMVSAHPHVFMDTRVEFQFGPVGMNGFWVDWLFDEIFSASIKMDFDTDRDNRFSKKEIAEIEKSAFSNLKNFNYFTTITINGKTTAVETVSSFLAEMKENRLIYRFLR